MERLHKHWTEEELDLLRKLYPDFLEVEIAKHIAKSPAAIKGKAARLHLTRSNSFISSARKKARELNTKVSIRTYEFNDSFFNSIDTEVKAYILGFIWADGFVIKNGQGFGIGLSGKDMEHLVKIRDAMGTNYPVREYRDEKYIKCRLDIRSVTATSDLVKTGICCTKTYSQNTPMGIPSNMMRHFIRGFFDGDGSVKGKTKMNSQMSFAATQSMCNFLKEHLLSGSITKKVNSDICFSYDLSGAKQLQRVFSYLYDGATIYLERKYNRFINFGFTI